jgi:hypothetical protein
LSSYGGVPFQTDYRNRRCQKERTWSAKPKYRENLLEIPEGTVKEQLREILNLAAAGLGVRPFVPTGITVGYLTYALRKHVLPFQQGIHRPLVLREVKIRSNELQLDCSARNGRSHQTLEGFSIYLADLPKFCQPGTASVPSTVN